MELGDVIFVRGHNLISKIITFFDKGRFSHVGIAMSDNTILEIDVDKRANINPLRYDDYEIVSLNLTEEQKEKLKTVAKQYIGYEYDYSQLLYYVLRRFFKLHKSGWLNTPNEFICSELVYKVLVDIGVLQYDERYKDITPNELYELLKGVKGGRS